MNINKFSISASFIVCLLIIGKAHAVCQQSAHETLTTSERPISAYLPALLIEYERFVPDGELYIIQRNNDGYYKMCNEERYVADFTQFWLVDAYPNGGYWKRVLSTENKGELNIDNGIYRIKKVPGLERYLWSMWKYIPRVADEKLVIKAPTIAPVASHHNHNNNHNHTYQYDYNPPQYNYDPDRVLFRNQYLTDDEIIDTMRDLSDYMVPQ